MSQEDTRIHPDALELAELLRPSWPTLSAELRARPTLVCEGEGGDGGDGDGDQGGGGGGGDDGSDRAGDRGGDGDQGGGGSGDGDGDQKPPWGDDPKNFDPDRAWKLVQDVRRDAAKAKSERDRAAAELKRRQDDEKSDTEKLEERATTAEKDATSAKAEAARLRVVIKKGLTGDRAMALAKRLVGDSEEDLEKDADDLLKSFNDGEGGGDDGGQEPRRRPRERLRTGATGSSEPEETDPEKLAAKVPRMY